MTQNIADIFDIVDTPAPQQESESTDKRQVLKDAIRRGQKHLLPKKCTDASLDKASPEAIEKLHNDFVQRGIQEKGENTARALSSQAITLYAKVVDNVVPLYSTERLRGDIEEDLIIRDSMTDLGILVFSTIGKFLAPLLLVAYTFNNVDISKLSKGVEEKVDEQQENNGKQPIKDKLEHS